MSRARRAWSTLRGEIRILLRETDSSVSYWTDAHLLQYFNACMDLRVMQMAQLDEGWVTDQQYTSLVADQREYPLPEGAGRVKKVSLKYTLGGITYERELTRDDQWGKTIVHGTGPTSVESYNPTFQLQANLIYLEPAPKFALSGGLQIDVESAPARISADADKLDLRFPDVMETLLIYDTALHALAVEQTQGSQPENYVNHLRQFQTAFEDSFLEYVSDRTEGRVLGQPWRQGD